MPPPDVRMVAFEGGPQEGMVGEVAGTCPAVMLSPPRAMCLDDLALPVARWNAQAEWYEADA